MRRVLVVDDEENIRLVLRTFLRKSGYEVEVAASAEEALTRLDGFGPDFVIADVRMPGMSGIELTAELKARGVDAVVVVMSAYGSVELAIEAMKAGAYDYIGKPFKQDELLLTLKKAEERESLRRENRALRSVMRRERSFGGMVGESEAILRVFRRIEALAAHEAPVLIEGEVGVGKERVARALHSESARASAPFVLVDVSAIPPRLLESELFGHVRGAFEEAHEAREGHFVQAEGGVICFDELVGLSSDIQERLLRVIEAGTIRPLGADEDRRVDVRIVAATVRDLERDVSEGRFREDLFERLRAAAIEVPPLRERLADLPLLLEHILEGANARLGTAVVAVEARAKKALLGYDWPGNIRELNSAIERAAILAEGETVRLEDLPKKVSEASDPVAVQLASGELSIKKASRFIEEALIQRALATTGGNRTAAAKLLEISHRALLYKIKEYGLK